MKDLTTQIKYKQEIFFFPACFVFSLAYYFMPLVLFLLISLKKAVLVAAVKEQKVRRAVFIRMENWTAHSLNNCLLLACLKKNERLKGNWGMVSALTLPPISFGDE